MKAANLPHILIIDDDTRLSALISQFLRDNDFITFTTTSADEARKALAELDFDLIVLDVMMPKETGHEFLQKLRKISDIPVLMLTALGEVNDKIKGLQNGADDYLSKPFEPQELVLRINAILRRAKKQNPNLFYFAEFVFDAKKMQLSRDNEAIYLTGSEAELLHQLCQRKGVEIERDELAQILRVGNDRAVDVAIMRLRKKIEKNSKQPEILQTVRGSGYRLNLS